MPCSPSSQRLLLAAALLALSCGLGRVEAATSCPNDATKGLYGGGYSTSDETDQKYQGGTLSNATLHHNSPSMGTEVSGTTLSATITASLYCASVPGAGCDGSLSHFGTRKSHSYCLGCSGTVWASVAGIGDYNSSIASTCNADSQCTCNSSGTSFYNGIVALGAWQAEGNCSNDTTTGSEACDCSLYDGTPNNPLGPYAASSPSSSYYQQKQNPGSYYPTGLVSTSYYPKKNSSLYFGVEVSSYFPTYDSSISGCSQSNCTCGPTGNITSNSSCGCNCSTCSGVICSCDPGGTANSTNSDATASCCTCSSCDTHANCSCSGSTPQATPSTASNECGCSCPSCSGVSATCATDGSMTLSDTDASGFCGLNCSSCSAVSCSCDAYGNSTTSIPDATNHCGCNCTSCASSATCSCDGSGTSTTSPPEAEGQCGCSCARKSCSCSCIKNCTCGCDRNTCSYNATGDDKEFFATGGSNCSVQAVCGSSSGDTAGTVGFYAGGLFDSAATQAIQAHVIKTTGGSDAELAYATYLTGSSVSHSSGVATFSSLAVLKAAASSGNNMKLYFTADLIKSNNTDTFQMLPATFNVYQNGSTSTAELWGTDLSYGGSSVELLDYDVVFKDSAGNVIDQLVTSDGFNASFHLITGASGDSSSAPTYTSSYEQLLDSYLTVTDLAAGAEATNNYASTVASGKLNVNLKVKGQVGRYFGILASVNGISGSSSGTIGASGVSNGKFGSNFQINPTTMDVYNSNTSTKFSAAYYPKIVKVDGMQNNTLDVDGLPNPIEIQFKDGSSSITTGANCNNCVIARLVRCSDALSAASSSPTCSSVAQAYCATSQGTCTSSTTYTPTLSGTTRVNMVNGTATFTDIQVAYTFGAGFRLHFSLNPTDHSTATGGVRNSVHSTSGYVEVPNDSYSAGGVNNSFFIRPYEIEVQQSPGGDGVDTDSDNIPDGVPVGMPFRVQPAIAVKGNGYYFDQNWNNHGYAPVSAMIKPGACAGNCTNNDVSLTGNWTGVASSGSTHTPSGAFLNGGTTTPTFTGTATSTTQIGYDSGLGKVGMLWRDLQVSTTDSNTAQEDLQLSFRVGPSDSTATTSYASADSGTFDAFIAPDTALNLRVASNDELGFRVEFDPATISRTKPLSGFIVEVDKCTMDTAYCTETANPYYDSSYGFKTRLGSDLSGAGGHTEEIIIDTSNSTFGSSVEFNITFTPTRTIMAGDSLSFFLGAEPLLLSQYNENCTIGGADAAQVTITAQASTSKMTITVNTGYELTFHIPVRLTIPSSCNLGMVDSTLLSDYWGSSPPSIPTLVTAAVLGSNSSTRFDNCKGSSLSCVASETYVLPTIQDSNSMDTAWSGTLRYGSVGATCTSTAAVLNTNTSALTFPANQYCTSDITTNDPDTTVAVGNSGDNGKPIGSNGGTVGSGGSVTSTGAEFGDSNSACRGGSGTKNPCALTVGADYTVGVNISLTVSSGEVTQVDLEMMRDRVFAVGDIVDVPITGLSYNQPVSSNSSLSTYCSVFTMGSTANASTSNVTDPNATTATTSTDSCAVFTSVNVFLNYSTPLSGWTVQWTESTSTLRVTVGSNVLQMGDILIQVGFNGTQSSTYTDEAIADVTRGSRTTLIFKNDAILGSYTAGVSGNPVDSYAQVATSAKTGKLSITSGQIYNFRVYAYNGRFRSSSSETLVQNRAISKPANPAYFSEIKQDAVGVKLTYNNIPGLQHSQSTDQTQAPNDPVAGSPSRIGFTVKPDTVLHGGQEITVALPGFSGPDILILNSSGPYYLYDDTYKVTGNNSGCTCVDGTISTPRNLYEVSRSASGNGSCTYNATATSCLVGNDTKYGTDCNASIPWCACSECACGLDGTVTTPATIYNVTGSGESAGCSCSSTGTPVYPATTYNVTGNCSECSCSSSGVASTTYKGKGSCDNCTCSGLGNGTAIDGTGADCTSCTCEKCDCGCEVIPVTCGCSAFLECSCGCPVKENYYCGCEQNSSTSKFESAVWVKNTSSIVLRVARGQVLEAGVEITVWVPFAAGITYPADSVVPSGPSGGSGTNGLLSTYRLNWVTPFPSATQPRDGFIVQFSSDLLFKNDIHTVIVPDVLDRGVVRRQTIGVLTSDLTTTNDTFTINIGSAFLNGKVVEIDSEFMAVTHVDSSGTLYVKRGIYSSTVAAHTAVTGGSTCSCTSNGTASGGSTCGCTAVKLVYMGATDVTVGNGIDSMTGYLGSACRIGTSFVSEGCNPIGYNFATGARTFQSAAIEAQFSREANWASACASGSAFTCTSNCQCSAASKLSSGEFGNVNFGNNASIASPANPLSYPQDAATTLVLATDSSSGSVTIAVASAADLTGKYIRIGDEIMYVVKATRGIVEVQTYQAFGGDSCSCTVEGVASGGSLCVCAGGSHGSGCTTSGTLSSAGGGGSGFSASFTIETNTSLLPSGFKTITVTQPGENFRARPSVLIDTGGSGCTGQIFNPVLSTNVLSVLRAQFGTTISGHALGSTVSRVVWPAQTDSTKPGLQYHWRIAAYNKAGMSDYIYFNSRLFDVFPRTLAASGGELLEIVLVGGGVTASNYTVYVGRLNSSGLVDLDFSRACTALQVLDVAGTRMSCRSPAWVGATHDLIVQAKSGSVHQIAVGNSWMKYRAPFITSVAPAAVDAGVAVNITIVGRNFGTKSYEASAKFVGATGEIACKPLTIVTDLKAVCTLSPKPTDTLDGNIVLTIGNSSTGGGQEAPTGEQTAIQEKAAPVEVQATVPLNIVDIPAGSPERLAVETQFKSDLVSALGVSASRIEIRDIVAGSVIIIFVILPDPNNLAAASPAALAVELSAQAADPNSALRQGAITSQVTVSLPPGTAELAAAEAAATTAASSSTVPLWESSCVPKSYTAFDMEICYDCCTYVCELGEQIPQVGGQNVLPGYRAQVCQGLCLKHCGYARPITFPTV